MQLLKEIDKELEELELNLKNRRKSRKIERVEDAKVRLSVILKVICTFYNIAPTELLKHTHKAVILQKRQVFFHFAMKFLNTDITPEKIGLAMTSYGVKFYNRLQVRHSYYKVMDDMKFDKFYREEVKEIEEKIQYALELKKPPTKEELCKIVSLYETSNLDINHLSKAFQISFNQIQKTING